MESTENIFTPVKVVVRIFLRPRVTNIFILFTFPLFPGMYQLASRHTFMAVLWKSCIHSSSLVPNLFLSCPFLGNCASSVPEMRRASRQQENPLFVYREALPSNEKLLNILKTGRTTLGTTTDPWAKKLAHQFSSFTLLSISCHVTCTFSIISKSKIIFNVTPSLKSILGHFSLQQPITSHLKARFVSNHDCSVVFLTLWGHMRYTCSRRWETSNFVPKMR